MYLSFIYSSHFTIYVNIMPPAVTVPKIYALYMFIRNYRISQKMFLILTLHLETATTMMVGILGFPICSDLYNSFDTLITCFHDLMNR